VKRTYNAFFEGKRDVIRKGLWQERSGIISRVTSGISGIDAKRGNFLKLAKDRHRYLQWLYQARKRYGLTILNYMVTSNHIHLVVADDGDRDVIPNSMQLVAGRTGQEFNQRKGRRGAYWEDRYHATAVESGKHLARCMVYIDIHPHCCPINFQAASHICVGTPYILFLSANKLN